MIDLLRHTRRLTRLLRILFWSGVVLVTVTALMPVPPQADAVAAHDKLAHAMTFGGLTLLGCLAYRNARSPARLGAGLTLFGFMLELAHYPLPYRAFSGLDVVANIVGVAVALLAVHAVLLLRGAR